MKNLNFLTKFWDGNVRITSVPKNQCMFPGIKSIIRVSIFFGTLEIGAHIWRSEIWKFGL